MRVLIVDDDPKYRAFVSRGLTENGLVCSTAASGEEAFRQLVEERFDLMLLDVMLPGLQGWDVLEALQSRGLDVPVIFVSARDGVDDRVRGLRMGGDDYIVKPFAFSELLARIHAVLRRRRVATELKLGDLHMDLIRSKVTRAGRRIDLTPTEFALLHRLAEQPRVPVSRTELLQSVWGYDFDPGTNVLEVHVRRLRKKLDDPFPRSMILTERGAGYYLDPDDPLAERA